MGQIIPWNFPILMAAWKLAPALAAGNSVVLKPAEQTPFSICALLELISDLITAGVVNVVQGYGVEAGKPLASSNRIKKIGFTGETTTGKLIMQYASENLIPVTITVANNPPDNKQMEPRALPGRLSQDAMMCLICLFFTNKFAQMLSTL